MERIIPIRILCVDDHPVVREGLQALLHRQTDMLVVGEASTAHEAVTEYRKLRPDVTLMDLRLPGGSGTDAAKAIRADYPGARIIVLTTYISEQHVRSALEAGVRGYLLKESLRTELVEAVRAVHRGLRCIPDQVASWLNQDAGREQMTARELEVLSLMTRGQRNSQIAETLAIAEGTVKVHVKNILGKLGVEDRTQAVVVAFRRGITHLD